MRIRKRLAIAPPPESLNRQEQQPCPNHPPIQEVSEPVPAPAPPRSDLQLPLEKGTNGWNCKTDDVDGCMHYEAGDNMIGKLSTAAHDHVSDDTSSSAKQVVGISSFESSAQLEMKKEQVQENEVIEDYSENMNKRRRKVHKDDAMTEDSRCSRSNGSGWRCWRQAVVGYSLCTNHSSRGKLRSKTSVKYEKHGHTALSASPLLLDEEPLIMLKKREKKKIAGTKNRSVRSLLLQTQPTPAPPMSILDPAATIF